MAQTAVILIRVALGLALGIVGVFALGQGLVMIAHVDFPTWSLALAMFAVTLIGSVFLLGAWRMLSATLRMDS